METQKPGGGNGKKEGMGSGISDEKGDREREGWTKSWTDSEMDRHRKRGMGVVIAMRMGRSSPCRSIPPRRSEEAAT
jgi:hypothetical protein